MMVPGFEMIFFSIVHMLHIIHSMYLQLYIEISLEKIWGYVMYVFPILLCNVCNLYLKYINSTLSLLLKKR